MNNTSFAPALRTARSSARFCTRVAPTWVHTSTRGCDSRDAPARRKASASTSSTSSRSTSWPLRTGNRTATLPAARAPRPSTSEPKATTRPVSLSTAATVGSSTSSAPLASAIRVEPVPKSSANSALTVVNRSAQRDIVGGVETPERRPARARGPLTSLSIHGQLACAGVTVTPGDFGEHSDEDPHPPLLPPDDRLWRHPSEVGASHTALPLDPVAVRRRWLLSHPSRRSALTAGVVGALLATGVVALGTHLADSMEGTGLAQLKGAAEIRATTAITTSASRD